jgi:ferredoxin-NADP reductase
MAQPRKIRCTVATVVDHGGRVYTVDLIPEMPVPAFRPGQFLHLTVDAYDPAGFWPDSRVFSVASSPRERGRVRICYAVKGIYTAKMERTLAVGGTVWIKLPYGEFVIDDGSEAVLLAGGTGISAFTAFLEALTPASSRRVLLVYGARTPDLWLFRDMLDRQASACPAFAVRYFAETGAVAPCLPGPLALDTVFGLPETVFRPASAIFYLSGPPAMLRALSAGLAARGVTPERIRTDAWE